MSPCRSRPGPAQVDELADPQTVAIGDKDHGRVAVAIAVVLGRPDQALDLGLGEVLASPIGGVRLPAGCDCSLFDGWSHEFEVLFRHGFLSLFTVYCYYNALLRTVCNGQFAGRPSV